LDSNFIARMHDTAVYDDCHDASASDGFTARTFRPEGRKQTVTKGVDLGTRIT
jgi:hypothetical protein